jgi:hypothetical protein
VSVSPTERLLRYKATEAWRSHVLLLEAREYERLLMEKIASREVSRGLLASSVSCPAVGSLLMRFFCFLLQRNAIRACPSRKETLELQSLRYGLHTSLERAEERIINEHVEYVEEEQGGMDFQLNIPDLSSFALRRVALALGLMRRLPIAGWLRCETPAP